MRDYIKVTPELYRSFCLHALGSWHFSMIDNSLCAHAFSMTAPVRNITVRFLLTTFPIHILSATVVFMIAAFLVFVVAQWNWNVLFHPLQIITYFHFSGIFSVSHMIISVVLNNFFLIFHTLFTSVTPCFFLYSFDFINGTQWD